MRLREKGEREAERVMSALVARPLWAWLSQPHNRTRNDGDRLRDALDRGEEPADYLLPGRAVMALPEADRGALKALTSDAQRAIRWRTWWQQ